MKQPMVNYVQNPKGDEFYTPSYAILPLLKYLKPSSIIWCPFDKEDSEFVKVFEKAGHAIYFSHIDDNIDFFNCTRGTQTGTIMMSSLDVLNIDYIISNPPYSTKNKVLEKLYELDIPFAMLMPLTTFETPFRGKLFKEKGVEVLIFDKRVNFMKNKNSNWFNTSYFCYKVLPKELIFETLEKS